MTWYESRPREVRWLVFLAFCVLLITLFFIPGTIVDQGPTIRLVGHLAPIGPGSVERLTIGSGPLADLRLTEALIPDQLGHLDIRRGPRGTRLALEYRHESRMRDALRTRRSGSASATDTNLNSVSFRMEDDVRLVSGLIETEGSPGDQRAVLKAVCEDPASEGTLTVGDPAHDVTFATVGLVDGEGIWIRDAEARSRSLVLPRRELAWRRIGQATLMMREAPHDLELALLPYDQFPSACDDACLRELARLGEAVRGNWFESPSDAIMDRVRAVPSLADSGSWPGMWRVIAPESFVQVGDGAPRPLLPAGAPAAEFSFGPAAASVYTAKELPATTTAGFDGANRVAMATYDVLQRMVSLVPGVDPPSELLVTRANTEGPSLHVVQCANLDACEEDCVQAVGRHPIAADTDWIVAGSGTHYRPKLKGDQIELRVEAPPSGRFRLLGSLAGGRLMSHNPHVRVPECRDDQWLVLEATTDERVLSESVEERTRSRLTRPGERVVHIPLPRWFVDLDRFPDVAKQGYTAVDAARLCSEPDGSLMVDERIPRWNGPPEPHLVADQSTFVLAGHRFQYFQQGPRLEQWLPLLGFGLLVVIQAWLAIRSLWASVRSDGFPWTQMLSIPIACVALLMIIGGLLQMHMSASQYLLGSPDYIHRHLVSGWVASTLLLAFVQLNQTRRTVAGTDAITLYHLTRSALTVVAVGAASLALWAAVDAGVWMALGPAPDELQVHEMVYHNVNQTVLRAWGVAGLLGLVAGGAWRFRDRLAETFDRWFMTLQPPSLFVTLQTGREPTSDQPRTGWRALLSSALGVVAVHDNGMLLRGLKWLGLATTLLAVGALLDALLGSRTFLGFDLKLAEFAPPIVGAGFASMLAGFSQESSGSRPWVLPARMLFFTLAIEALVIGFYGLRSDFGPLLVVIPSIWGVCIVWAFEVRRIKQPLQDLRYRLLGVLLAVGLCGLAIAGILWFFRASLTELPLVGVTLERGLNRFATWQSPWFTRPGWWATRAHWILAGFYGDREVFLSNLHSDLAFFAVIQSYGVLHGLIVLSLYGGLVASLLWWGHRLLVLAEERPFSLQPNGTREWSSAVAYFSIFAGFYILMEVLVHIGTCFNTVPQTGITLPWVSSGGSAATGFAILVGWAMGAVAPAHAALRQPTPRGQR
ncbi:MAG: hypothetical protein AAGA48_08580 [Myxococcota bacterium]